jgi:hypothetical protein
MIPARWFATQRTTNFNTTALLQMGQQRWSVPARWFATKRTKTALSQTEQKDEEIVLYEKSPGNVMLVRSGLGFSTFHCFYWIWYIVEFVPTVNKAALEALHVDPMLPMAGLTFAFVVQTIFTGYTLQLVSKVSWRPFSQKLNVYTHSFPFVLPSKRPEVTPVGEIRLDPASIEAQKIAVDGWSNFKGLVTIGKPGSWPPYLVHVQHGGEIKEPEIMLEMLLEPERIEKDTDGIATTATDSDRMTVADTQGLRYKPKARSRKRRRA